MKEDLKGEEKKPPQREENLIFIFGDGTVGKRKVLSLFLDRFVKDFMYFISTKNVVTLRA